MNKKWFYGLWACLFILCAAGGFIPEPAGALRTALTVLALLFFLPPALLLYRKEKSDVRLISHLSGLSLGLTLLLLILNFFSAFASEYLGQVLHYLLVIVSSPMVCSGHWVLSLFLWACLLTASLGQRRK